MRRILRVGSYPTIENPGVGRHIYEISNIKDYETTYLTPEKKETFIKEKQNVDLVRFWFFNTKRNLSDNILKKILFISKRLFFIFIFTLKGVYLIFKKRIRIIHIHSPMFIGIAIVANLLKLDCYITFHGTDFLRVKHKFWFEKSSYIFKKIFILSPHMKDYFSGLIGEKNVVRVFNSINSQIYKNFGLDRKKQILAVGSLKEEKGFEILIKSFASISSEEEFTQYKLKIAGDGIMFNQLQCLIEKLSMGRKIELIGHQTTENLVSLYNESEFFVLSSLSEGYPKALQEAIACGCKIISTDIPGAYQILENLDKNSYILADKNSVASLSGAIMQSINLEIPNKFFNKSWLDIKEIYAKNYNSQ